MWPLPLRFAPLGLLAGAALWCGCSTKLPEPESKAAKLYASRCSTGCHRVFAPQSLKYEMWKIQVDRMQDVLARHGMPPLTAEERSIILDYLRRHSG